MSSKTTIENALIVRCFGTDPDEHGTVDVAIVELSDSLANTVQARQALCRELRQHDATFSSLCYWDDSPVFLESIESRIVRHANHFERNSWCIERDVAFSDERAARVTECCMVVTPERFWWSAYAKHEPVIVSTLELEIERLIQVVERSSQSIDIDRSR